MYCDQEGLVSPAKNTATLFRLLNCPEPDPRGTATADADKPLIAGMPELTAFTPLTRSVVTGCEKQLKTTTEALGAAAAGMEASVCEITRAVKSKCRVSPIAGIVFFCVNTCKCEYLAKFFNNPFDYAGNTPI